MQRKFTEQEQIRRNKLEALIAKDINPFYSEFKPKNTSMEVKQQYDSFSKEELADMETEISVAGRIMMIRDQGKAAFVVLKDEFSTIQAYIRTDSIDERGQFILSNLDMGDIIGVVGKAMKTNTGELSVRASYIDIVAKALRPLPEKFHGLTDIEERYRRRYVDLIVNEKTRSTFVNRTNIIKSIRNTLDSQGYMEVDTPILSTIVGGAAAEPFLTHHNVMDMELSLRIATELHLKRLIVGGFEKVYEMGRIFRNEGISNKHNPEFTTIEIYEAYADMNRMIDITEEVISDAAMKSVGQLEITYQETNISLKRPFKRIEMSDLVKEATGVDFNTIETFEEAVAVAKDKGINVESHWTSKGHLLNAFFEEFGEKACTQPTFVTGYPVEVSPLAKLRKGSKEITDRFELFIGGREYANGYAELNDADDQYSRFESQLKEKDAGNIETQDMDLDFIEALETGMPTTGGLGIGIDRLVMLLTDSASIRDVLLFPHQKPKND